MRDPVLHPQAQLDLLPRPVGRFHCQILGMYIPIRPGASRVFLFFFSHLILEQDPKPVERVPLGSDILFRSAANKPFAHELMTFRIIGAVPIPQRKTGSRMAVLHILMERHESHNNRRIRSPTGPEGRKIDLAKIPFFVPPIHAKDRTGLKSAQKS